MCKKMFLSVCALSLCLTTLFLVGCGSQGTGNTPQPGQGESTPTPTSSASKSTNPTPTSSQSGIRLVLAKQHFATNEAIAVEISNSSSSPIYASKAYTNCSFVTLEWQSASGAWLAQGRCPSVAAHAVALATPSTMQQLSPSSGPAMGTRKNSTQWQPGTYRLSFSYTTAPDQDTVQGGTTVVSETFTVG